MRSKVLVGVLVLSLVTLSLVSLNVTKKQTLQQKATGSVISPKKGVGGPATLTTLSQIKASWFHNWYYQPTFKDLTQNWSPAVWQKFVPLFYGKSSGSTSTYINDICNRTSLGYCNKGNYYLVGNEPDVDSQDKTAGTTNAPRDAAIRQGQIIKAVRTKDSTAKFIILGLSNGIDTAFIQNFISEWKNYWQINDPTIADLSNLIRGWHFHNYENYDICPTNDDLPRSFANKVNQQMIASFGKIVPNQEIWITEMGSLTPPNPNDTSVTGKANRQAFLNRMSCLVNVYENSPIVTRYAWFYHGCDPASTTWTGCPTYKCTSFNLFYVQNCSSAGGPMEISDLGLKYAALPVVVSPTSVPLPTATQALTLTPTLTSTLTLTPIPTATPTLIPLTNTPRPTNTSTPALTLTPTPTRIVSPNPTPTLTCDSKCFYGLSQCINGVTPKTGYSCRINRTTGFCPQCNSATDEWCWAYCKNAAPTSIPTATPTLTLSLTLTPTPTVTTMPNVSLTPTATVPPNVCPLKSKGDADCNNKIVLADFFIWRREFLAGTHVQADFNANGIVDIRDFFAWRNGFLGR